MNKVCKFCEKEFSMDGRVFSNHVRWCDKNPTRNNTQNLKVANNKIINEKYGELVEFNITCCKCNKSMLVKEREFSFPLKDKYFCSKKCSFGRNFTQEYKDKISKTIISKIENGEITTAGGKPLVKKELRKCFQCNADFEVSITSNKIFCNMKCFNDNRRSTNEFLVYKHNCQFKFNVWKYPDEFKLDLIKEFGWYKAFNRGNNLTGVSRDHKISVSFGWNNKIPAEIISHPANCELMQHAKNISKHANCSIELEQLMENINNWNKKYLK